MRKRYLVHGAAFNLGLLMRALFGAGTPREAADRRKALYALLRCLILWGLSHARALAERLRDSSWSRPSPLTPGAIRLAASTSTGC